MKKLDLAHHVCRQLLPNLSSQEKIPPLRQPSKRLQPATSTYTNRNRESKTKVQKSPKL
jgi:hypothetical protein